MTRTPPSETSDTDASSRRSRLRARRSRRTRLTVLILVIAIAGVGGAVAYAVNLNSTDAHAADPPAPTATTFGNAGTLVPPTVVKAAPVRSVDHTHPLKLWIGGDSLAGSFGPALGDRLGATGVVSTVVDYKTSSGLWSNDIRNWYEHASEQMTTVNPDAVVFIIGTNDASIVNGVDSNGDHIPDGEWESQYRLKIDRMMDLFVGTTHRTVYWLGPPTLGTKSLDRGAKALGELMRQEAAKRSADVVYLDTYSLFSSLAGTYSRSILDENGKTIVARIADGVHFTEDGADYLARAVFLLIDGRWKLTNQADLLHPIGWVSAPGSGEVVPGFSQKPTSRYRSGNNSSGNSSSGNNSSGGNSSSTTAPSSSATTVSPQTSSPSNTSPSTVGSLTPSTSHTTPTTHATTPTTLHSSTPPTT